MYCNVCTAKKFKVPIPRDRCGLRVEICTNLREVLIKLTFCAAEELSYILRRKDGSKTAVETFQTFATDSASPEVDLNKKKYAFLWLFSSFVSWQYQYVFIIPFCLLCSVTVCVQEHFGNPFHYVGYKENVLVVESTVHTSYGGDNVLVQLCT